MHGDEIEKQYRHLIKYRVLIPNCPRTANEESEVWMLY
jgi:hypothetical protein